MVFARVNPHPVRYQCRAGTKRVIGPAALTQLSHPLSAIQRNTAPEPDKLLFNRVNLAKRFTVTSLTRRSTKWMRQSAL
jgi:hypothetical protein